MNIKDANINDYYKEKPSKIEITHESKVFSYYLKDGEGLFDTYQQYRAWCVEDVIERNGLYCFDIEVIVYDGENSIELLLDPTIGDDEE